MLAFFDAKDPIQRRVELFCSHRGNGGTNLCKLMGIVNGPCLNAKDMATCFEKQCERKKMSTMPICKKNQNLKLKNLKSAQSTSMPLILQLFDVKMLGSVASPNKD